ncbi:uncharacterized protein PFL1_05508 [Pseudozyma flocculosa PF-1]|uniref:Uncharacterized protein n=1 Tax=Pseudozyma flocculosa PF-1 TaxID=1277687 RepID=A0A061H319_9BASI|nr:uncharacterized protein PFL1_05508 [Pseudozyma flocculosa PF-1]EPQ26873.1 hypothetical protein PFL1_05508 [Pseudozyma flocculosa PF-1]
MSYVAWQANYKTKASAVKACFHGPRVGSLANSKVGLESIVAKPTGRPPLFSIVLEPGTKTDFDESTISSRIKVISEPFSAPLCLDRHVPCPTLRGVAEPMDKLLATTSPYHNKLEEAGTTRPGDEFSLVDAAKRLLGRAVNG